MTHNRTLTLLPPPGRRVPRRNSSTGEGGWALWRPLRTNTDRNTGRGPPERNRQTGTMAELGALEAMAVQGAQEAMAELGAQEAMADGLRGLGLGPLGLAPTAGTHTTPPKISLGKSGGIRSPPGLDTHKQNMIALQG